MAITITVNIDDTNEKILKNDLLDLNQWVQDAVVGKENNAWKRFQTEWTTKLMNDSSFTDPIPSNKTDFVNLVTARSDYKTRQQREDELGD
nr:hypothetical protein [uncultured Mediterranean phage uvMED]